MKACNKTCSKVVDKFKSYNKKESENNLQAK